MLKKFFTFGELDLKKLCAMVFLGGLPPMLAMAFSLGKAAYGSVLFERSIRVNEMYTFVQEPSALFGILCGAAFFFLGAFLWRLFCEVLYIILRYFHSNAKSDRSGG